MKDGIGELKTVELLDGICGKVEDYELIGRNTGDTDQDNVATMVWLRAEPNNVAYRVNPRIGLERMEIKAYCEHLIEQVETSLVQRLQGEGDVEPIASARSFLCELETQECVGDPKERLRLRHEQEERSRQGKKKRRTARNDVSPSHIWEQLGSGCCRGLQPAKSLFNDQIGGVEQCQAECIRTAACRFAMQGWGHAPAWCVLAETCERPLDNSSTACGSTGANGVVTWELSRGTPSSPPKTKKKKKKKGQPKSQKKSTAKSEL